MKSILLALSLLLMAMASPMPPKAQTIANGWINITDPVLNPVAPHVIARHYLVWDGRASCGAKVPRLVIALHGGHGNATKMATEYLTPQGCYVVAYPSGSNKGLLGQIRVSGDNLSWNTSSPYETGQGWAGEAGVNDDLFITSLVTALKAQYGLSKVLVVGVSRGGMLAFHLACDTTLFSVIATVATTINDTSCNPATHIPNLHIHGTADDEVCWNQDYASCAPWPKARPKIVEFWQASGVGHDRHIIIGGTHQWQPNGTFDTLGTVWHFLDTR